MYVPSITPLSRLAVCSRRLLTRQSGRRLANVVVVVVAVVAAQQPRIG